MCLRVFSLRTQVVSIIQEQHMSLCMLAWTICVCSAVTQKTASNLKIAVSNMLKQSISFNLLSPRGCDGACKPGQTVRWILRGEGVGAKSAIFHNFIMNLHKTYIYICVLYTHLASVLSSSRRISKSKSQACSVVAALAPSTKHVMVSCFQKAHKALLERVRKYFHDAPIWAEKRGPKYCKTPRSSRHCFTSRQN